MPKSNSKIRAIRFGASYTEPKQSGCISRTSTNNINFERMKKGMIFDLYQDGQTTKRVMAVNETDVLVLEDQTFIFNIDFENEVVDILIYNIFE